MTKKVEATPRNKVKDEFKEPIKNDIIPKDIAIILYNK